MNNNAGKQQEQQDAHVELHTQQLTTKQLRC